MNPNSGDTGGILDHVLGTVHQEKINAIKPYLLHSMGLLKCGRAFKSTGGKLPRTFLQL
jgi:hypothetical protein